MHEECKWKTARSMHGLVDLATGRVLIAGGSLMISATISPLLSRTSIKRSTFDVTIVVHVGHHWEQPLFNLLYSWETENLLGSPDQP